MLTNLLRVTRAWVISDGERVILDGLFNDDDPAAGDDAEETPVDVDGTGSEDRSSPEVLCSPSLSELPLLL